MNAVCRKAGRCPQSEKHTKNIRINTHDILDYKFSKNVRKPISNIKWWVCSSLACLLKQSNTLLLYNTERERAQDRATEQGSGF